MSITCFAESLTGSVPPSINQFFNDFKTLHFKSLKCLIVPKVPSYFIDPNVIAYYQMEKLCVGQSVYAHYLRDLTSVKELQLILGDDIDCPISDFPPNLERLTLCRTIDGVPSSSKIELTLLAGNCKKLKYL